MSTSIGTCSITAWPLCAATAINISAQALQDALILNTAWEAVDWPALGRARPTEPIPVAARRRARPYYVFDLSGPGTYILTENP